MSEIKEGGEREITNTRDLDEVRKDLDGVIENLSPEISVEELTVKEKELEETLGRLSAKRREASERKAKEEGGDIG